MKQKLVLLFVLFSFSINAQTFITIAHGDYDDDNIWAGGVAPSENVSSGQTIIINHDVAYDQDINIEGQMTINTGGSITSGNKKFEVESGGKVIANGLITAKELNVKDNGKLIINGNAFFDKKLTLEDADSVVFNGNTYIADDIKTDDNANITISAGAIVQVVDVVEHDGNNLTINGGLIAGGGGNTNESENGATINGTGLFQIDGDGIDNDGSIAGSLDVCSGDGTTNPVSGNGVSRSATVCSSSGVNFPIIPAAPLPVDLVAFEANLTENNFVELLWITASEINNDYFTIEKADENEFFEQVTTIPGVGNSNVTQVYKMVDDQKCEGICYYRLKQTDFDGKTTTYDAVGVVVENKELNLQEVKLYPNPLRGNTVTLELPISENQEVNFFVNDLLGREYVSDITMIDRGDYSMIIMEFNQMLPKGIYLISMIVNKEIISKKLYVE